MISSLLQQIQAFSSLIRSIRFTIRRSTSGTGSGGSSSPCVGYDVGLTINGSSIIFTAGGDVLLEAHRLLITDYEVALHKCPPELKIQLIKAFEEGGIVGMRGCLVEGDAPSNREETVYQQEFTPAV